MPIIPPSMLWVRAAVATVTAAADHIVTEPIIAAAENLPPPKEQPKRYQLCGVEVDGRDNSITKIFDADMTVEQLNEKRDHYIETYEEMLRFEIVDINAAAQMKPGDIFHSRRLEIMESNQTSAYRLMGWTPHRISAEPPVKSIVVTDPKGDTDIFIETVRGWMPFSKWWAGR